MKRTVLLVPLLLLLGFGVASGQEAGRYRVDGSEPGWGAFRGEVRLEPAARGRQRFAGAVRWANGTAGALRGTIYPGGAGALVVEQLTRGSGTHRRVGRLPSFVGNRGSVRFAVPGRRASWRQRSRTLRLKVMSFNVLGFKADWVRRRGRVAAAIRAANSDVVCFQEVVGQSRGRSAQVNSLAKQAGGYRTRFEGFRKYSFLGPWMGNAVIARWPIRDWDRVPLPRGSKGMGDYPRGVTWARVSHPSGAKLDVGSLHLHQRHAAPDRALRVRQVQAAEASGVRRGSALRLLVGDFNASPRSGTYAAMSGWRDLWAEARPGDPGYTSSVLGAGTPRRIDYVFARPPTNTTLVARSARLSGPRTRGDAGDLVSDHKALLVELTLEVPLGS